MIKPQCCDIFHLAYKLKQHKEPSLLYISIKSTLPDQLGFFEHFQLDKNYNKNYSVFPNEFRIAEFCKN